MRLSIEYEGKIIEFEVQYRKRKTLSIQIDLDSNIKVISPMGITEKKIKDIVKSKGKWINKKLLEFKDINKNKIEREFKDGDKLLYLGEDYLLRIYIDENIGNKYKIELINNEIKIY